MVQGFYAYAASPREIGSTIEQSIKKLNVSHADLKVSSWKALDIVGHFISEQVLKGIDDADFLIADITVLNFNVTYEIGYAIGKKKRILLTKNNSLKEINPTIKDVGIFDTIGYQTYENSDQLTSYISNFNTLKPLNFNCESDRKAPVYLLEARHKTDWMTRIISRIKKSGYIFRNFDPAEQPRLSGTEAISHVAKSLGVVVPLLASNQESFEVHNMRGAFIAGLADGMDKALVILQHGEEPVPIDYRDFVKVTFHPNEVNEHIADFAAKVAAAFQDEQPIHTDKKGGFLQGLDLGASSAENEMRALESYYLKTDQFLKSIRGEAHLVVGRKGSGKSAIFLQVRDRERNNSQNIVLDLKPDGYKLLKFKELILGFLQEGTFQHVIMAFWEYVLLLEICYKILEKDRDRHIHDTRLYAGYRKIAELYHAEGYETEGDFSERMTMLMTKISSEYLSKYGDKTGVRLSTPQITELLYLHDVRTLSELVIDYLKYKEVLWLLFDNLDKGWPTSGLKNEDLLIIRALIDATRKIERQFDKQNIRVNTILFLRNDVYELLVLRTADRGKEANVMLDWTDPDLLRELLRLRIVSNGLDRASSFESVWLKMCVSHYDGEESSSFLIDRSLMRPRFLLNLLNQCKSYAINLNHTTIHNDDIKKGLVAYSTDLLTDISYEMKDIAPHAGDILYAFIGCNSKINDEEARSLIKEYLNKDDVDDVIELLLWYGFFGIYINENEIKYIYNLNYNMQLLKGLIRRIDTKLIFNINPAFWEALMIK